MVYCLLYRVAGTQLLRLQYPVNLTICERFRNCVATMAVHDMHGAGIQFFYGIQYVGQQGAPRQVMQNLWHSGAHTGARTRGENNDFQCHDERIIGGRTWLATHMSQSR